MNVIEAMRRWPDQEAALAHLERVRWQGQPNCPYCNSLKVCAHASKDKKLPRWQCQTCRSAFSATVGTIFHHTHLSLRIWFLALALILDSKSNINNVQLAQSLNIPYKTAWSLAVRIRRAMVNDPTQSDLFAKIIDYKPSAETLSNMEALGLPTSITPHHARGSAP